MTPKPLKRYPIEQSRLYRLSSKKRLAALLGDDLRAIQRLAARADNYRVFCIRQDNGRLRTIEEPKPDLKKLHARLAVLLARIEPPVYLHSGTKGRSYLTNAKAHLPNGHVIKTDVSRFYPSTTTHHVFVGLLREFKCTGDVARLIATLSTFQGHLPTGSPVSMLLAFYAHKQIFDQLYHRMKDRSITMTVYVDDLALSGEQLMRLHLCAVRKSFQAVGLACHKTRFFPKHAPKLITGTIITDDGLRLPNRRHLRIAMNISRLEMAPSYQELQAVHARLLGQLTEAARLEDRWKARLPAYKSLLKRIALRGEERLRDAIQQPGF